MTIYVNPTTGNDNAKGTIHDPLKTLTRAIQQAKAETVIQLATGVYDATNAEVFPLIIPAGVIVVGDEAGQGKRVIIRGGGQYNSPTFKQQNVLLLLQDNAQLLGVTITNPTAKGTGIWLESTSPTIAHNTFMNCGREGIFVTGKAKPIIQDNYFTQNQSSGVFFVRNGKGEVRRNLFENTGYGIAVSDWAAPLIVENEIKNSRLGIFILRNARPVLRYNIIEQNMLYGIRIEGQAQADLGHSQDPAGNQLKNNRQSDLINESEYTVISAGNLLSPHHIQGKVQFIPTVTPSPILAGLSRFSDIAGHWAEAFIQALVKRGILQGFPDKTFRPQSNLTRAEYAAILAKTFDFPHPMTGKGEFRDVSEDHWARMVIQKAANMGFLVGFPDGTFRPQNPLTRIQAFVSLVNGLRLTGSNPNLLSMYRDRAQIPSYATNAVATATQKRMVVNYPQISKLHPLQDITRAEMATLIYQALVVTQSAEVIRSPYIISPTPSTPSFSDIQNHWAKPYIQYLSDLDLITGFADGKFQPNDKISRAEYGDLVMRVFNAPPLRPATEFLDIESDFWAFSAIQRGYRAGFLSGFPDSTFHPEENLSRLHLILSLVNGLGLPMGDESLLEIYEDRDNIPDYAKSAISSAVQANLMTQNPHPNLLRPHEEATRAETTAMIYQALAYQKKANSISSF